MAVFNGPPRGGSRGGRDQFDWENVRNSGQDATYYIGHSVKALNGRWQKGKDVYWYTREKKGGGGDLGSELQAVKAREERLMSEALGLKPREAPDLERQLDRGDMHKLLQRTGSGGADEADHVKGVGFAGQALAGGAAGKERLEGYDELADGAARRATPGEGRDGGGAAGPSSSKRERPDADCGPSSPGREKKDKRHKKEKRKDKDRKREKKERHRERKEKRHRSDRDEVGRSPRPRVPEREAGRALR